MLLSSLRLANSQLLRKAVPNAGLTMAIAARPVLLNAATVARGSRSYHDKVIDHYNNPRNVGSLDKTSQDVGTGLVGAPACGDVMRLQIQVDDDGIIKDVRFKTFGCGSAIASSSYMTTLIRGMSLDDAAKVKNTTIAKELSLPPVKLHCSMLAEDAIKSAIKDYNSKRTLKKPTLGPDASAPSANTAQRIPTKPSAAPQAVA